MAITHIVLVSFKPGTGAQEMDRVCAGLLALKDNCLHPTTQKPYILSATGGKNNSPEGLDNGLTHAFVMQFDSAEDRDYYVYKDPAHRTLVDSLSAVDKICVVDYQPGAF